MELRGTIAALATRHGKQRVIGPVLERAGMTVRVAPVDTDRFGTFAGDVRRLSTPLATARAKAHAALAAMPEAELGLASEGTFGPLPGMPFFHADQELILLVHRVRPFELVGNAYEGVSRHPERVTTVVAAEDAAERIGFPTYGVIVVADDEGRPAPLRGLCREIRTCSDLRAAADDLITRCGSAWIEPDRRADRDPERMRVIARATEDLLRRLQQPCPSCRAPGYDLSERRAGLPCEECGAPTDRWSCEVWRCWACERVDAMPVSGRAPMAACPVCHP